MSCSTCTRTKPIITCGDELIIAGGFTPALPVSIYPKNTTLEKTYLQSTTVTADGNILLDLARLPAGALMPQHAYELWVTDASASAFTRLTLTYGEVTASCLDVPFIRLHDGETEEADTILSQTIELSEE